MLVTYMDAQMNGNEPKTWKTFVSGKKNDAVVFIKNLMNNDESREFYDDFGDTVSKELKAEKHNGIRIKTLWCIVSGIINHN